MVGLHRPSYRGPTELRSNMAGSLSEGLESAARSYLTEVGVADALIDRMLETPSANLDVLSRYDLQALNQMDPQYAAEIRAACGALTPQQSQQYITRAAAGTLAQSVSLLARQTEIAHCRALTRNHDRQSAISAYSQLWAR